MATEQALATAERELEVAKTTFPLNVQDIVAKSQDVKSYEKALTFVDKLAEELGLRDEDLKTN